MASVGCLLTYVFPVYFGIDSVWAFVLLAIGFLVCAAITLAPLGRRKRLTVAAEAEVGSTSPEAHRGSTSSSGGPAARSRSRRGPARIGRPRTGAR